MANAYTNIAFKRVYDAASDDDGLRLLADRIWPRGISKEQLAMDRWIKQVCPSTALRKAWHTGLLSYEAFSQQYLQELSQQHSELLWLAQQLETQRLTLLTAVKCPQRSHLPTLRKAILQTLEEIHDGGNGRASPVCYSRD